MSFGKRLFVNSLSNWKKPLMALSHDFAFLPSPHLAITNHYYQSTRGRFHGINAMYGCNVTHIIYTSPEERERERVLKISYDFERYIT